MADLMTFPETLDEFIEQYKIVDSEQVYTNGAELVPIFRIKQWEDVHERKKGRWIKREDDERISGTCSCCGWDALLYETDVVGMPFCPNCGAEMEREE